MQRFILIVGLIWYFLLSSHNLFSQLIDSFTDGDFTSNPTWVGDIGSWQVVTNSAAGPNTDDSYTLRLNAPNDGSSSQYLCTQLIGSWGNSQSWGFWLGRRTTASSVNQSIVWLWANESDLESSTVDGYRIKIGQTGADYIVLQRVDNGVPENILTSLQAIPSSISNYSILIRVTRSPGSIWTIFTSVLPEENEKGPAPTEIPDKTNTPVNQGSIFDDNYINFSNGYFGVMAIHTSSDPCRTGAEFDQFYFEADADISLAVNLLNFNAIGKHKSVHLNWSTVSEINNAGFELARSEKKSGDYVIIASYLSFPSLKGQVNSNHRHDYHFTDYLVTNGITYWYKLINVDLNGKKTVYGPVSAIPMLQIQRLSSNENLPSKFTIYPNYPNPFNPRTTIRFDIPAGIDNPVPVNLSVYNASGQQIRVLYNNPTPSGSYTIEWDGRNHSGTRMPSGIYFAVLKTPDYQKCIKMILMN